MRKPTTVTAGRVAEVRERLDRRAWVFDDPRSYAAGVEEALRALTELPSQHGAPVAVPSVSSGLRALTA